MSSNSPEISIIIPCFNVADYISNTIQNCLNQSYTDFELILVNDSSEDLSSKIINEYQKKDKRIKLITNQTRRGAGYSRNVGLRNSSGKYVIFLDADDYFSLTLLEKLYLSIKNYGSQIAICNYTSVDENMAYDTREFYKKEFCLEYSDKSKVFQMFTPIVWNKLYDKSFLKENSILFDELYKNNDLSFVFKTLLLADKLSCVDEYLIDYRRNSYKSISNTDIGLDDLIEAVSRLYDFIKEKYKNDLVIIKSYLRQVDFILLYYILVKKNNISLNKSNKFINEFNSIKEKLRLTYSVLNSVINEYPIISILIPVYNSEKYISKTIESILCQTMPFFEIIIVDDGSSDHSKDKILSLQSKDSRIKYFYQKNSGPSFARQLAISKVRSPFVMFCDSDDYYHPNMCKDMLINIWQSKTDFVMCDCNIIYEKCHNRSKGSIDYNHLKQFGRIELTNGKKQAITVTLWNKIFRMSIIADYNISFPPCREHDDASFVWQYLAASKTAFGLNKKLYNYVLRGDSIMGSLFANHNQSRINEEIFSLDYTAKKLYKYFSFKQRYFFIGIIESQLKFYSGLLSNSQKKEFFNLAKQTLLKTISLYDINRSAFVKKIYQENFAIFNNQALNHNQICKKNTFEKNKGLFRKIVSPTKFEYRLFGISMFKVKIFQNIISFYLFGVKIFRSCWRK